MKNGFDTGSTKKDSTFCKNNHSQKVTGSIFKMASNLVTCSDLPSATVLQYGPLRQYGIVLQYGTGTLRYHTVSFVSQL